METGLLLVLVPHRDARLPLRAWSDSLFAAGLLNGWSFPGVAPLARLKRPLLTAELKSLAHALRGAGNEEGKIINHGVTRSFERERRGIKDLTWRHGGTEEAEVRKIDGKKTSAWGPSLNLELSDDFFAPVADAIDCRFSPIVLGAALMQGAAPDSLPAPPQVSFRAAALANMEYRFRPDGEDGDLIFEWGIGPLHWLPKKLKY